MNKLKLERAAVPVLGEADAVVIGGSLAGIACALELAAAGKRVWLIEPRTYMGSELTATLRPWLELPPAGESLPALIGRILDAQRQDDEAPDSIRAADSGGAGYAALHPDRLKLSLEDALEAAGVRFLYASLPVGIERLDGRAAGVVIANKSGRQLIAGPLVVDATETALAASLCGEEVTEYRGGGEARYMRTLEFVGVDVDLDEVSHSAPGVSKPLIMAVPADIGADGGEIRLRQGYRGRGHVYAEFAMTLPSGNTLEAARNRELEARRRSMGLAVHLMQREPAFVKAVLSASSNELSGPLPIEARPIAAASPERTAETVASGVWSLFRAVYLHGATELLDPIGAAAEGERLGRALAGAGSTIAGRADAVIKPGEARAFEGDSAIGEGREQRTDCGTIDGAETVHPAGSSLVPAANDAFADVLGASVVHAEETELAVRIPVLGGQDAVFPMREVGAMEIPVRAAVDVLVAGGGTSGACAAFTAAGEGVRTALVDLNPGLGGTGTFGGVDSYWFGRKAGYAARIQDAVLARQRELRYKGHKWNIEAKMHALLEQAAGSGVDLFLNVVAFGAVMRGSKVSGAIAATRWGPVSITAGAVIDATGDGDLAAFAGADYVYGSERDHTVMWYSLAQYTAPDKIQNNFTSMVDVSDVLDYTRAILAGRRRGTGVHDHGSYIATRESRHVKGDVVMKLSDQLLHRRWPDAINVHFSNHDVKGVSGADWVNVGLIPPNLEIEIPYRMLLPEGLDGLLVAGKAVSATHDALPAIRMQADLENLGGAAALAAVQAVRAGVALRAVDIRRLQRRLTDDGLLPEGTSDRTLRPVAYGDEDLERLVASIESDRPLYEYSNMRMNEIHAGPIPFVEICSVGPRIAPFLERALGSAEGLRRIHLAQALAMIGSNAGVSVLIETILRDLSGSALPPRTADIMYVQLPPDHGAMPDPAYLMYSLAQAKDKRSAVVWNRAAELLHPEAEDFRDSLKGLYYYIDAVCQGAERLGDPIAIPALQAMRRVPFLRDQQSAQGCQPDYFLERRAMLELAIGRALAACGSAEGYEVLIGYLTDARVLLARQALLQLRRLSGLVFPAAPEQWTAWLAHSRGSLRPKPNDMRLDIETDSASILR
ncbi:FAD-dependent oxidoreductase [Paenibacillus sacheonensis]|uniref:FAD-dependent oxidoreductase n=1 Tax=Paenibacillus sacheonensis TaxID=742054 RepID=A0A7X4YLK7_9BACL|nr:FAD-dependent oxidoreductase [Paenibacillus sacheonensis]MBM7564033.1 flavin-dependent dehydrogenase [Paenibacillus sacheonensis]NBC67634.1 FAD-dependent oxidoreductase [Paenibacillus sacheonensis]